MLASSSPALLTIQKGAHVLTLPLVPAEPGFSGVTAACYFYKTAGGRVLLARLDGAGSWPAVSTTRRVFSTTVLIELAEFFWGTVFRAEGVKFTYVECTHPNRFETVAHTYQNGVPIIHDRLPICPELDGDEGYSLEAFHRLLNSN